MQAGASESDQRFARQFEAGEIGPSAFDHRGHLRLAYVCLCDAPMPAASERMRLAIQSFLHRNEVDALKFHETMTAAWLGAVRHFMELAGPIQSFDELVQHDSRLLDQQIMLTHYSKRVLFSDTARRHYVAPDLQPIPAYRDSESAGCA